MPCSGGGLVPMPEQSSAKALPNVLEGRGQGTELIGSPPRKPFLLLLATITIPIVFLDQVTKMYVQAHMALYESIALIPNYLDITYTLNPGAAFSMLANAPPWLRLTFLLSMSTTMSIVLLVLLARSDRVSIYSVAFAVVLGGAVGNLIDRALRGGHVIDFMRAHYYDLNYPIFNVADSAVSIGVVLIILASFFSHEDDPKPSK
jgi:signal peptidase II